MKRELISSIQEKELQLAKLKEHINKSKICSDLYDKLLLEKAILNRIKHLLPRQEKLICDYFKK